MLLVQCMNELLLENKYQYYNALPLPTTLRSDPPGTGSDRTVGRANQNLDMHVNDLPKMLREA